MAAYRGAGRPIMSYALERLVDHAARELGMDPAEFRRRNMIPTAKFPYKIAAGFEYDCGDFAGVHGQGPCRSPTGKALTGEKERIAKRAASCAAAAWPPTSRATGAGGFAPQDQVEMRWDEDGSVTLVRADAQPRPGPRDDVRADRLAGCSAFRSSDPPAHRRAGVLPGRQRHRRLALAAAVGSVMLLGAQEMVKKGLRSPPSSSRARRSDIEFVAGDYRIKGTDRKMRIDELAKIIRGKLDLDFTYQNKFGATFPNGCHIAEVEIEPETGEAEIVSYVACDDAGNIINHQIVEGQMQGGLTQGAGQVFSEQAVYDAESGQLLTGSFMDYAMPRAGLVSGAQADRPSGADRAPIRSAPRAWARRASPARCRR